MAYPYGAITRLWLHAKDGRRIDPPEVAPGTEVFISFRIYNSGEDGIIRAVLFADKPGIPAYDMGGWLSAGSNRLDETDNFFASETTTITVRTYHQE